MICKKRHSHCWALLFGQVGECGHTKETRKASAKQLSHYWDEEHQRICGAIKEIIARHTLLAYPICYPL